MTLSASSIEETSKTARQITGLATEGHLTYDDWMIRTPKPELQLFSKDVAITYMTDKPYAIDITSQLDVVSLKLGLTKGQKAWNSDKLSDMNLLPGHAYVFPKGARVLSIASVASSFPMIGFSKSFQQEIVDDFGSRTQFKMDRIYEDISSPALLPLAQYIQHVLFSEAPGNARAADAIGTMVMTEILRITSGWDAVEKIKSLDQRRLMQVLDHIDDDLAGSLTSKELAKVADMSVFHFTRAFTAATGVSPHRYVVRRRVERAQHMIEGTRTPIAEIAYDVGFSSQAHLNSVFKKHFGVTPGRLRKSTTGQ